MARILFAIFFLSLLVAGTPVIAQDAKQIPPTCQGKTQNAETKMHCLRDHLLFSSKPLHPLIIRDLLTGMSDRDDQIVAINLDGSVGSNKYCCDGGFAVTKKDNKMEVRLDLVEDFSSQQMAKDACRGCAFTYRFEGTTRNGVSLIRTWEQMGGSGVFSTLIFVTFNERKALRQTSPTKLSLDKSQIIIEKLGQIELGDRKGHTIKIDGDFLILDGQRISVPFPQKRPKSETTLNRLGGAWISDIDALNEANKREGKPAEEGQNVKVSVGQAQWNFKYGDWSETFPFYLAKDTIWQGDLCRGGEFDVAVFQATLQDNNGTVIVSLEDGDVICRTLETLTKDKLIISYVGARLNFHYYKRPN